MAITDGLIERAKELCTMHPKSSDGDMEAIVRRGLDRSRIALDRGTDASTAKDPSQVFKLMAQSCNAAVGTTGSLAMSLPEAAPSFFQRKTRY